MSIPAIDSIQLYRFKGLALREPKDVSFCWLNSGHLDEMLKLQRLALQCLPNPDLYEPGSAQFVLDTLKSKGYAIGAISEQRLIGFGLVIHPGTDSLNLGYDLGFSDNELLKVGQLECDIVDPDFRGNGLQYRMGQYRLEKAIADGYPIITATVHPDNVHSLNNLSRLGLEIRETKIKYGAKLRHIMAKDCSGVTFGDGEIY